MFKKSAALVLMLFLILPAANSFAGDDHHDHGDGHICFTRIDTDQDDVATFEEFSKVLGNDQELYKAMDIDGDGKLTHEEYEEYHYNKEEG